MADELKCPVCGAQRDSKYYRCVNEKCEIFNIYFKPKNWNHLSNNALIAEAAIVVSDEGMVDFLSEGARKAHEALDGVVRSARDSRKEVEK